MPPAGPAPTDRLLPATVQAVIAARIDQLSPAARELVRRASVVPAGPVRRGRAVADRRAPAGVARRGGGRGAAAARRGASRACGGSAATCCATSPTSRSRSGSAQRLHLRVANKLSEPGARRSVPADDRVPPGAGGARGARPQPERPHARRPGGRCADAGRRRGAAPDRVARGRRPVRARAGARRAARTGGASARRGSSDARRGAVLARRVRRGRGPVPPGADAGRRATIASSPTRRASWPTSRSRSAATTISPRALFDRSLDAARRLGDPYVLARTLLMAGWVPFWRQRLDEAEAMFREALDVVARRARRDAWAEVRALVGLASVTSPRGERGRRARARARGARDRRGVGAAVHGGDRPSGRGRLVAPAAAARGGDRARRRGGADPARARRPVGAGERARRARRDRIGSPGRLDEAELDLREAFVLCRDLKERALVTLDGRRARADARRAGRRRGRARGPRRSARAHRRGRARGRERARDRGGGGGAGRGRPRGGAAPVARGARGRVRRRRCSPTARRGRVVGRPSVRPRGRRRGAAIDEARELLERNGWRQALREPDLVQPR